jgi:alkylhydroperoxidase/carboxymuconolactone decarboxylase family protein YurZ
MTENEPSGAQKMFGEFAPKLAQLTDDVLFGDVWERPELSPRDRSLVTITALVAGGNSEQLGYHMSLGRKNGLTEALSALTGQGLETFWKTSWCRLVPINIPMEGRAGCERTSDA